MTAAEVAQARVSSSDGKEHGIPLMAELFERFPEVRFNIDAKSDESVEPLAALVDEYDALERVCLASFKLGRIRALRELLGPGLMTNMSPTEIASLRLLGRLRGSEHRSAQVPTHMKRIDIVNQRFIARARKLNIAVHVWTINERDEMDRLFDLGVDGVMTDETSLLREVLAERGQWPT